MSIRMGLVEQVVGRYMRVKAAEKMVEARERQLDTAIRGLNKEEFEEYVRLSMELDARDADKE